MKILIVHTYYVMKGGEDAVFEQECALLQKTHEVAALVFYNKTGWKGAIEFVCSIWNVHAAGRLRDKIKSFQPDLIHLHNFHFSSGPIIIRTAKKLRVPLVLTLHNYRLLCPSATLSFDGQLFRESLSQNFPWKAIKNKVYRGSSLATFWLAFVIWFHHKMGTWKQVDRYIALTAFARDLFLSSRLNIDPKRIVVKANFVNKFEGPFAVHENSFLFVGRLSQEKGITTLLAAFKNGNAVLNIVGEGPLGALVRLAAADANNINYLGILNAAEVRQVMARSTALIVPSLWYEGMPMTILEAFSIGLPVIASNIGALSLLIKEGYNGLHFSAGDANGLSDRVNDWTLLSSSQQLEFRRNALRSYTDHYTPEGNISQLLKIYHALA